MKKDKIKLCDMCFQDSDLDEGSVEIVSEVECVEEENKEFKIENDKSKT